MATYGRGLICLPMTGSGSTSSTCPLMVQQNTTPFETAFLRADRREGHDEHGDLGGGSRGDGAGRHRPRARVRAIWRAPDTCSRSGRASGGVLVRAGQTEAAVDLARIAGLYPAGVICEIMNEDGTMARVPELDEVRQAAQAADDHDRGSHQVPDAHRGAREADRLGEAADRARRVPHASRTRA